MFLETLAIELKKRDFLKITGVKLNSCSAMMDCLVNPLQDRLEDWKKGTVNLDKEHNKGLSIKI
jgi:hypothetical protein